MHNLLITTKLALVDALNPCTLAIQAALLSILLTRGRRQVIVGGTLFIATVYVMYLLYGLLLYKMLSLIGKYIFPILLFLLVVMSFLEILAYFRYKPGMVSLEMPMKFRPITTSLLEKVSSPLSAIPLAIAVSLFLLPCSSGPYAVFLGLETGKKMVELWLLLYYLLIFVSPMILITLLVYFGVKPERVKVWREKHIRDLHLIAGVLLFAVFLYLLFGYY